MKTFKTLILICSLAMTTLVTAEDNEIATLRDSTALDTQQKPMPSLRSLIAILSKRVITLCSRR